MKYFEFFDRIKAWAKENNTTIEAVVSNATDKNLTVGVYHGWKLRESLPSGEYCYDIAQYMGVTCDWLISGKEPKTLPAPLPEIQFGEGRTDFVSRRISDIVSNLERLDDRSLHLASVYIQALSDAATVHSANVNKNVNGIRN